jgi:hypothetical protein
VHSQLKNTPETGKHATHGKQKSKKEQRHPTPEFTDSERESGDTPATDGPSAVDVTPGLYIVDGALSSGINPVPETPLGVSDSVLNPMHETLFHESGRQKRKHQADVRSDLEDDFEVHSIVGLQRQAHLAFPCCL